MLKTRIMSGAFLTYKNEVLLMHRNPDRKIAPGVWAPIGGHIEPHEINNPMTGCLREIEEETGICAENIIDLTLRYITVRRFENEIRMVFTYTGEVAEKYDLPKSDEGVLCWIDYEKMTDLPMMFSMK
jgi:8-oxo-dGTP diphosphatase